MSSIAIHEQERLKRSTLGFWLYLMSDCMLFASLFITFAVLRTATAGGPSSADLFDPQIALFETLILLTSSFTCGIALLGMRSNNIKQLVGGLVATFALGAVFLAVELYEFIHFASAGHDWTQSAFLSSFFTLVGTHGLHILIGLIWLVVTLVALWKRGLTAKLRRQLASFGLFWHFLDLVWIFIFTSVYLIGVAQ